MARLGKLFRRVVPKWDAAGVNLTIGPVLGGEPTYRLDFSKELEQVTSAADSSHDTDVKVTAVQALARVRERPKWQFQHSSGGGWATTASAVSVTAVGTPFHRNQGHEVSGMWVDELSEHSHVLPGTIEAMLSGGADLRNMLVPITVDRTERDDSNDTVTGTFDRASRIHSIDRKPALVYSDGRQEWYWHGVRVPMEVIVAPATYITVERIDAQDNAEVRRVMLEIFGIANYLAKCKAKLRHKDECGELYERKFGRYEEPLMFVKVRNSTPEPDGSVKDYFLRVPPRTRTAREGVAWTFAMTEKQYAPVKET